MSAGRGAGGRTRRATWRRAAMAACAVATMTLAADAAWGAAQGRPDDGTAATTAGFVGQPCPSMSVAGLPAGLHSADPASAAARQPSLTIRPAGQAVHAFVRPDGRADEVTRVLAAFQPTATTNPGTVVDPPVSVPEVRVFTTDDGHTMYLRGWSTDGEELWLAVTGASFEARRSHTVRIARATYAQNWRCPVRGLPDYLHRAPDAASAAAQRPALTHLPRSADLSAYLRDAPGDGPVARIVVGFRPTAPVTTPGTAQTAIRVPRAKTRVTDDPSGQTMYLHGTGENGRDLWAAVTGADKAARRDALTRVVRATYAGRW